MNLPAVIRFFTLLLFVFVFVFVSLAQAQPAPQTGTIEIRSNPNYRNAQTWIFERRESSYNDLGFELRMWDSDGDYLETRFSHEADGNFIFGVIEIDQTTGKRSSTAQLAIPRQTPGIGGSFIAYYKVNGWFDNEGEFYPIRVSSFRPQQSAGIMLTFYPKKG